MISFNDYSFLYSGFQGISQKPQLIEVLKKTNVSLKDILKEMETIDKLSATSAEGIELSTFLFQHPNLVTQMLNYILMKPSRNCNDSKDEYDENKKLTFYSVQIIKAGLPGLADCFFDDFQLQKVDAGKAQDDQIVLQTANKNELFQICIDLNNDNEIKINNDQEPLLIPTHQDLMNHFLTFLDEQPGHISHYDTRVSYFCCVLNLLIEQRPTDLLDLIFVHRKQLINELIRHISSTSIKDFLTKLIITPYDNIKASRNNIQQIDARMSLIDILLNKMLGLQDVLELQNICLFFTQLIQKIKPPITEVSLSHPNFGFPLIEACDEEEQQWKIDEKQKIWSELLNNKITTQESIQLLFNIAGFEQNRKGIYYSLEIILAILELDNIERNKVESILKHIVEMVPRYINLLKEESSIDKHITLQFRQDVSPVQQVQLQILRLFHKSFQISIGYQAIACGFAKSLIQADFFTVVKSLILKHPWNNFLHIRIFIILFLIVDLPEQLAFLIQEMLDHEKGNFYTFLIDHLTEDDFVMPGKAVKIKKGYRIWLIQLANQIIGKQVSGDDQIKGTFSIANENLKERWQRLQSSTLSDLNAMNLIDLGGSNPYRTDSLQPPQQSKVAVENQKEVVKLEFDIQNTADIQKQTIPESYPQSQSKETEEEIPDLPTQSTIKTFQQKKIQLKKDFQQINQDLEQSYELKKLKLARKENAMLKEETEYMNGMALLIGETKKRTQMNASETQHVKQKNSQYQMLLDAENMCHLKIDYQLCLPKLYMKMQIDYSHFYINSRDLQVGNACLDCEDMFEGRYNAQKVLIRQIEVSQMDLIEMITQLKILSSLIDTKQMVKMHGVNLQKKTSASPFALSATIVSIVSDVFSLKPFQNEFQSIQNSNSNTSSKVKMQVEALITMLESLQVFQAHEEVAQCFSPMQESAFTLTKTQKEKADMLRSKLVVCRIPLRKKQVCFAEPNQFQDVPFEHRAPEMLFRNCKTDKSDVWQFGCLMHELIGRRRMWVKYTQEEILAHLMAKDDVMFLNPLGSEVLCRDQFSGVLEQCFLHDESQRPSILDLIEALENIKQIF